jgi:hypothetical protein
VRGVGGGERLVHGAGEAAAAAEVALLDQVQAVAEGGDLGYEASSRT